MKIPSKMSANACFQGRRVVVMVAQSKHPQKQVHMLVFEGGWLWS